MATFTDHFHTFCNFGLSGPESDGHHKKTINDKNVTKMFQDCKLYGKHLTTTDTDIAFNKVKTLGRKELSLEQLHELMKEVAGKHQMDHQLGSPEEAYQRMLSEVCVHGPAMHSVTHKSLTGNVDRLTDAHLYTGASKERFDESTGKGKGLPGRTDVVSTSGYVANYKEEGTYDKKHPQH